MNQSLPPKPSLEHLQKQAKTLLAAYRASEPAALEAVAPFFDPDSPFSLVRAQLVIARGYGFASWASLKRFVSTNGSVELETFIDAALGGQLEVAKKVWQTHRERLAEHPAAAALAGDVRALERALVEDSTLVTRSLSPKDRPILCYTAFSRLIAEPDFEEPLMQTARLLLNAGADPNAYFLGTWGGETFHETAIYGAAGALNHAGLTKLLLDAGADPNEGLGDESPYRGEALYHASEHPGQNECLRLLLEAGMSQPALDWCICRKLDFEDPEGVLLFIQHGSNLNTGRARTVLSHALTGNRSAAMIRLLLENGADPNAPDVDGSTPYVIARQFGRTDAAELLVEFGARPNLTPFEQLLTAAAENNPAELNRIAAAHPEALARVRAGAGQDDSVLHHLARQGIAAGLAALLDLGLDPARRNGYNETPLHWACLAARTDCARILVERGAPFDVRDRNHSGDPLGWAIWGSVFWLEPHGDHAETVAYMLDAGAPLPDQLGGSPEVQAVLRARGLT